MPAAIESPDVVQIVDEEGFGLRVQFLRDGDRYAHRLLVIAPDELTPVIASIDSGGDAEWPPSPPLQQLSIEHQASSWAALGVGQAGTSHWSASVQALGEPHPTLRFDLACRLSIRPSLLSSEYRWLTAPPSLPQEGGPLELVFPSRRLLLTAETAGGPTSMECRHDRIRFVCGDLQVPVPATVRWGYRAALLPRQRS